mgnify:CR=1 FL=1
MNLWSFIYDFMRDRLNFTKLPVTVAVHSTCSTTKMGSTRQAGGTGGLMREPGWSLPLKLLVAVGRAIVVSSIRN